jgi:LmbE family N-acetylglucosaminyl deacetylase
MTTNDIIKNYKSCFFISPHFDDAALSVGSLMITLVKSGLSVTVINIFTQAYHGGQTLSAKKYLKLVKYNSPQKLIKDRRNEDYQALTSIGVKVINLNYTDALWRIFIPKNNIVKLLSRIIPELHYVYPVYRFQIETGKISNRDLPLIQSIATDLRKVILKNPQTAIFCPIGLGGHVDHCIVRQATEVATRPYFWLDQPYAYRMSHGNTDTLAHLKANPIPVNLTAKNQLLKYYQTQISALFSPGKIPKLTETIYEQY